MKTIIALFAIALVTQPAFAKLSCDDIPEAQLDRYSSDVASSFESFKQLAKAGKVTAKHIRLIKKGAGWQYYQELYTQEDLTVQKQYNLKTKAGFIRFMMELGLGDSLDDIEFRKTTLAGQNVDEVTSFHGDADFYFSNFYYTGTEKSLGIGIFDDSCEAQ